MTAEVWQFIGALVFFALILVGSYSFVYLPGKTPEQAANPDEGNSSGDNRGGQAREADEPPPRSGE